MKIKDCLDCSNAKLIWGNEEYIFTHFSKDTRTIAPKDTYIGFKGENFDGSTFFEEAFKKGADTCILQATIKDSITAAILEKYADKNIILVDDPIEYIMYLASKKRERINVPVVAITGSVGKTSTKNMVAQVLANKYSVLKSIKNENARIGMSLRILNYQNEECMVLEMGMNYPGEMALLSKIARPDLAVITNIGTSHIGNLGSRENILKEKLGILVGLTGPIIVNNDNDLLNAWVKSQPQADIITYGIKKTSDYQALDINYEMGKTKFKINDELITIPGLGEASVYNSLVAYLVGDLLKVEHNKIIQTLSVLPSEPHRLEVINYNDYTIIDDTYNSSYESVKNALEALKSFKRRKIVVLGDILELGSYSEEIHTKIGELIVLNEVNILVTVGSLAKYISDGAIKHGLLSANVFHFKTKEEAVMFLTSLIKPNDVILLKASHSMNFDWLVNALINS